MTLKMPFGLILNISVFHHGATKELVPDVTSKFGKGGKVIAAIVNFFMHLYAVTKACPTFFGYFYYIEKGLHNLGGKYLLFLVAFGKYYKTFFFFWRLKEYFFS